MAPLAPALEYLSAPPELLGGELEVVGYRDPVVEDAGGLLFVFCTLK